MYICGSTQACHRTNANTPTAEETSSGNLHTTTTRENTWLLETYTLQIPRSPRNRLMRAPLLTALMLSGPQSAETRWLATRCVQAQTRTLDCFGLWRPTEQHVGRCQETSCSQCQSSTLHWKIRYTTPSRMIRIIACSVSICPRTNSLPHPRSICGSRTRNRWRRRRLALKRSGLGSHSSMNYDSPRTQGLAAPICRAAAPTWTHRTQLWRFVFGCQGLRCNPCN
mmetsp:Transcript_12429/g.37923  ORF Transcript_12429/g.37923 Transcript_12429/m.37923 type:complete len:225 (+) Transcript_12429:456-1130(+)